MSPKEIFEFWNAYREKIGADFANFDNYFKYIFYEVDWVCRQEIFNDEEKKRYVRMIQSQMNNEELFCYVVNLLAYCFLNRVRHGVNNLEKDEDSEHSEYLKSLRDHSFFNDLYLSPLWESHFKKIDDESKELLLTGRYMKDVCEFRDNEKKVGVLGNLQSKKVVNKQFDACLDDVQGKMNTGRYKIGRSSLKCIRAIHC